MRGATECAKRLKSFVSALRSRVGKVSLPSASDPITQLILGVLSRDVPEARAAEGLERLREVVVDYNELRVIPPIELAELLGDYPDARLKCEDISRALNTVFAEEHTVSLDRLAGLSRRDAQAFLDGLEGLEPYTRARIRLLALRQHAVPLDEAMWALVRREKLVAPRCPLQEAQQFLERQVPEEDALEFFALLKRHAWAEMGAAVRKREVERIHSVPPDRTSRNMLQLVERWAAPEAALSAVDGAAGELAEAEAPLEAAEPKARPKPPRSRVRSAARPGTRRAKPGAARKPAARDKRRRSEPTARARGGSRARGAGASKGRRGAASRVRPRRQARKSAARARSA